MDDAPGANATPASPLATQPPYVPLTISAALSRLRG